MACKAEIFQKIYLLEGKFSDDPNDPGGPTNWGITLPFWKEVTGQSKFPEDFVEADAERCYDYLWDKTCTGLLHPEMRMCYFAFAVNAGWPRAHKILQTVVGVSPDGKLGPISKAAIMGSELDKIYFPFVESCISHYFSVPGFQYYGRGWMNRLAQTLIPLG